MIDVDAIRTTSALFIFEDLIQDTQYQELFNSIKAKGVKEWDAMRQTQQRINLDGSIVEQREKVRIADVSKLVFNLDVLDPEILDFNEEASSCKCPRCRLGRNESVTDVELGMWYRQAFSDYKVDVKKYRDTGDPSWLAMAALSMGVRYHDFLKA